MNQDNKKIAIVGNGPAGLMAAYELSSKGYLVDVFDKNPGFGRKLLIAGSSGLNIANIDELEDFCQKIHYDETSVNLKSHFEIYFTSQWLDFIKLKLKFKTFLGTSDRYFIEDMHSAKFVQYWIELLVQNGVKFFKNKLLVDFEQDLNGKIKLIFEQETTDSYDAVGFYLGGGSWELKTVEWPKIFIDKGYKVESFSSKNAGFELKDLSSEFFIEANYQPIKDCILKTSLGEKRGDLLITNYGLEGTPVYQVGVPGHATVDLLPSKSVEEIEQLFIKIGEKENLNIFRRVNSIPGFSVAVKALIFHSLKGKQKPTVESMSKLIKNFPLHFGQPRPLKEAISSSGGIRMENLNSHLMSKLHPGIFFGGEMLNWSAPTGGYLIQTCVTQGYVSAQAMINYLDRSH